MRYSKLLSTTTLAASVYTTFAADAAPVISDNSPGAFAMSSIPGTDGNGIFAEIVASTSSDGQGVEMTININGGVARTGGPFMYHIHEKAISSPGNCTSAGGHLDPKKVGDDFVCDPDKKENCQVGDLSGKHGTCKDIPGCNESFRDAYLSLTPGNPAYFGDKSFVLHYANKTRIACGNFVMGGKSSDGTSTTSSSASSTASGGSGVNGGSGSSPASTTSSTGSATSPSPSAGAASAVQAATGLGAFVLALMSFTL